MHVDYAWQRCQIVNIKPGRVGGLTESIQIHNYCMEHNVPVWCGGMVEMGIHERKMLLLRHCLTLRFQEIYLLLVDIGAGYYLAGSDA